MKGVRVEGRRLSVNTVQQSAEQYNTALYSVAQCSNIVQYSTTQYGTIQ